MHQIIRKANGGNPRRNLPGRAGRRLLSLGLVVVMCLAGSPVYGQQRSRNLVPASFAQKIDSQGYVWDIERHGAVDNGTDHCFSHAAMLTVNNSSFSTPQSPLMTADGSEYVLSRQTSGVEVTRRVKVDVKAACVRYVEMFRNPGPAPVSVQVRLQTHLGRTNGQALVTDRGLPAAATLGEKDCGLILFGQPNSQQLSVVFYLGGARSKVKPTIQNQSNYQVSFSYALTIEPGKTTSIIHGLAQRRLVSIPNAKAAGELFKPFHSRAWIRDLPRDVRRSIVNLGGYRFGGWGEGESFLTLESLDVDRQAADVLAIGDETRLHGTATCKALAIQTRYGDLTLPFEEVAALAGERYTGGRPRLFLRDGQVLNGQIDASGLQFALHSGLQLELELENLDRLVMRSRAEEAELAEGVVAMLETVEGDRLALLQADDQRLAATTPWGDRQIGLDEIQRMFATEQKIGHHLVLRDGSRLFAFVGGSALTLRTLLFGVQPFTPVQIRRMTAVGLESSEQDADPDIAASHVLLMGDNLLVGQVDVTAVHFVAGGQSIPVPPSQIRVLRNVTDEADGPSHQGPLFEADLWDGGTVRGELTELVLPIRAEDRVAQVPVHDVLEVRVPTPMVPDRLRTRIAQLIRDLGHPEYATRKAAKEALAELGHLPKLQLSETLKQTSDPEVRRSVEALLEELRE